MNNRWKRVAKLNGWNDLMAITSSTQSAIYQYDEQSDDYKCVAWADDFKPHSKGFRKGIKHYATNCKKEK